MSYLLDTHVWLWLLEAPGRIRPDLLAEMRDPGTQLFLSAVSSWEVAIKWAVGRISLPESPVTYVPRMMQTSGVGGLAVGHSHALAVAALPRHHADPFDRLLITQSQLEAIPIVTADPAFDVYDVEIVKL